MKKTGLALLLLATLGSCSKSDGPKAPAIDNVIIDGTRDLSLSRDKGDYLDLNLSLHNARQQPQVQLSVRGVPAGIGVNFDTKAGYPSFHSKVLFTIDSAAVPGTYPIQLIASIPGEEKTATYELKLTVPEFNGAIVNDQFVTVKTATFFRNAAGASITLNGDSCWLGLVLPLDADLIHMNTYQIVSNPRTKNEIRLAVTLSSYIFTGDKAPPMQLQLSEDSSQVTIICPRTKMLKFTYGPEYVDFMIKLTMPLTR